MGKWVSGIALGLLLFVVVFLAVLLIPRWVFFTAERRAKIEQVCNTQLIGLSSLEAQNRISAYRLPDLVERTHTGLIVGLLDVRCEITLDEAGKVAGVRVNRKQLLLE